MLEALWQKINRLKLNPLQYFESIENSIHIPDINMDEVRTIISAITNATSGYATIINPKTICRCTPSAMDTFDKICQSLGESSKTS